MFQYLILGVVLLVAVALLSRWFASSKPSDLAKWLKWTFMGLGAAATIYLAVTGKMNLAFIPLALIVLPRLLAWFSRARAAGAQPSAGKRSDVETAYLRMSLDHDSGAMEGTVLRGACAGRELRELSLEQLLELLAECRTRDVQAVRLLETYVDRTFGPEWRQRGEKRDAGREPGRAGAAKMTREEAYEVLGLKPGASADEIKEAHRSLMLKLHPDHGGSNYLAAKINQAKDLLLVG
jgi:hypothetical protein